MRRLALVAVVMWSQAVIGDPDFASAAGLAKPYDFDGDGYADLAVGIPNDGRLGAGAVNVLYGSKNGITTGRAQLWSQAVAASRARRPRPSTS
ncbi:MAG TPA: FG-GAP repeat protein, partial [Micropruina sp.]|nr:FG-GAP repeat protein [Micropruina sp.]